MPGSVSLRHFHTPFSKASIKYLVRKIHQAVSEQKTAATLAASLMNGGVVSYPGVIKAIAIVLGPAAPASGESMVFDVLKNGTSVLTSAYTYDSTKAALAGSIVDLTNLIDPTKAAVGIGDKLEVTRTYTAGGGPTPMTHTRVFVEFEPDGDV